ncbi:MULTISPECIES: PH domain-containing protein [unclassified Microbacterium]|uniref:PH domain-containing protein n=1 Tax=unclassified Microbacterium TaxID=2609290 RepID=UPI00214B7844|nr:MULTISPECIES: PH domain-containing protein [unclassified Microbacterium]MCR2784719.1 PH domain-containing protein [Microbacterium sp. zg.B96]WIM16259.1 PH domain-containing protein [Microbacterium sp. zg-B96]
MTDQDTSPPPALVRSPLSDGEWHRVHPLTPLLRGGLALIVVVGVIVANLRDRLIALFVPGMGEDEAGEWDTGDAIDWVLANNLLVVALLILLAVILALVAGFYLSWRFHTFRITDDDVEVKSGIFFRTQRRAPLDRVQGVNLTRPMVARLLGMAKLEVVGAGTDSNVKLDYLTTTNAEEVRADILRLASGRRLGDAASARAGGSLSQTVSRGLTGLIEGDDQASSAPESVVHIPAGRLVASQIISPATVGLLLGVIAVIIGAVAGVPWLLLSFVPALIGFGAYWIRQIVRSLRYSIAPTPDGVRITFGLLTTVTEIVPPGRVHALEVSQSILWRGFGWWTIKMNRLTGRSAADTTTDQFTTVLPVGTYADVERVLHLLLPHIADGDLPALVRQGVDGPAEGDPFTTTPKRARIIRLLSWRRNGFVLTDDLLLLRRGAIWRKLAILPLARLQSVAIHQGPLDRLLRVAAVRGHIVTGPVYANVSAIDRDDALGVFDAVAAAAVRAAATDRSHRWAGEDDPDLQVPPMLRRVRPPDPERRDALPPTSERPEARPPDAVLPEDPR